jgi:hypothetical protein
MKLSHQLLTLFLLISPLWVTGQLNAIDAALQKGSASELGPYFNKTLELSLPGFDETLATEKVIVKLTEFFTQKTIKGYKRAHESAPQEGRANFSLGDLYTAQGTFRISIYLNPQHKITGIRIQK